MLDQVEWSDRQALAIEGAAAKPALAEWVIMDGDALGEDLRAERVEQEAGLAGDGGTADRRDEMAEQGHGDARVEQNGHHARLYADGIEAGHGALCGSRADVF